MKSVTLTITPEDLAVARREHLCTSQPTSCIIAQAAKRHFGARFMGVSFEEICLWGKENYRFSGDALTVRRAYDDENYEKVSRMLPLTFTATYTPCTYE